MARPYLISLPKRVRVVSERSRMSRSSTILGFAALALALALGGAGCKQGIGQRCEIDSDCSSGRCSTNVAGVGGTCEGTTPPPPTPKMDSGADAEGADGPAADAEADAGEDAAADVPAGADAEADGAPDVGPDGTVD
jgi:hypothetical protein